MDNQDKIMKYVKSEGIHYVPVWRIIGFTGANVAVNMYMGITMIMAYYLNGFVGMAVILASSFSTLMRLWDGITDPIVGLMVEKFGNKLGKTRSCLIAGGVLLALNSFLMFCVTDRIPSGILRTVFFIIFTLLFYIGYTFMNISYHTGNVCLTNDPNQRIILSITGTIFVRIMRALTQIFSATLAVKYGSMRALGFFHEYWLFTAAVATVFIVIAYISIAPKDIPYFSATTTTKKVKVKFSDYKEVFLHNKPARMMMIAQSTDRLGVTVKTSAVTLVLYGIVAGNYKLSGGWTMYTTIVGLAMMTLGLGVIGTKLGCRKAMLVGSIGVVVLDTLAILLWILGDPMTLNLPGFSNGYGQAFNGFTMFTVALFLITIVGSGFQMITSSVIIPMLADINDYEASRTGKYIPGMMGTMFSFIDKLISSFGPLLVGFGFTFVGYADKLPDIDSPYSVGLLAVALIFNYGFELVGAMFNIYAMKNYELTPEKMKEIKSQIGKMRNKEIEDIEEETVNA